MTVPELSAFAASRVRRADYESGSEQRLVVQSRRANPAWTELALPRSLQVYS
jgi:hypothetical protein